jgi:hypothetical protein
LLLIAVRARPHSACTMMAITAGFMPYKIPSTCGSDASNYA